MTLRPVRRSGKSLIELVVVIGLMSSLLGITGTTLHRVIRAEVAARRANDRLTAVSRSAIAFRGDVHAARDVQITEEGRRLTCQLWDGTQIEYVVEPDRLTRITAAGREAYVLQGATVKFQTEDRTGRSVQRMVWSLPTAGVTAGMVSDVMPIPIEARTRPMMTQASVEEQR